MCFFYIYIIIFLSLFFFHVYLFFISTRVRCVLHPNFPSRIDGSSVFISSVPPPQVVQSLKRPLSSPVIATGIKRPSIIQTIQGPLAPPKVAATKLLSFTVDPNKTAKQLSLLRHSYTQCPFPEEDEVRGHSPYEKQQQQQPEQPFWILTLGLIVSPDLQANRDHRPVQRRDQEVVQ